MNNQQLWRNFDWALLLVVLALCGIGIAMIYSATYNTIDLSDYWYRQTIFFAVGLIGLLLVSFIDYRHLQLLAPPAFILFVLLLVAVFLFGETQGTGAQRWISIGGVLVQPTEPGKFLYVVFAAWYLSWFHEHMYRLFHLIISLVLLFAPLALIYLQPDLSMAVTYGFIGGILLMIGGIRYRHFFMMAGSVVAALPIMLGSLQGYMLERIEVFVLNSAPSRLWAP